MIPVINENFEMPEPETDAQKAARRIATRVAFISALVFFLGLAIGYSLGVAQATHHALEALK